MLLLLLAWYCAAVWLETTDEDMVEYLLLLLLVRWIA